MTDIDSLQKTPDFERQDTLPVKSCSQIDKLKEEVYAASPYKGSNETILSAIWHSLDFAIDHLASQGRILQDGFVAVPVEPTEEMIAQGMMHIDHTNMSKALPHVYKAMIAAQEGKE